VGSAEWAFNDAEKTFDTQMHAHRRAIFGRVESPFNAMNSKLGGRTPDIIQVT
jgi:hypothetical protein